VQIAALISAGMLAFLAMPYERTIVPQARLQIQDDAGNAQAGILVKEHWRDWSSESTEHEVTVRSDSKGYVVFPKRTIRTCRLCIFVGAATQVASQGVHASFGPVAFIEAYGKDPYIWTFEQYIPGKSLPIALHLKRWTTPLCAPEQLALPCLPR